MMAATAAMIVQLRRMVAEPDETMYDDANLASYIENYAVMDCNGESPYEEAPNADTVNPEWITTYDLNAAAADVWGEKAATAASKFDVDLDGARFLSTVTSGSGIGEAGGCLVR
jgi:hypothetical protein